MFSKTKMAVAVAAAVVCAAPAVHAQDAGSVKIGVVSFLSGPAAGPFGVPARNAAELTFEMLNGGKVPAPYSQKGLG
ncbi:MAG: ABC transporter substrate-binding protein, partial [Quisquiliibacterium sp.]